MRHTPSAGRDGSDEPDSPDDEPARWLGLLGDPAIAVDRRGRLAAANAAARALLGWRDDESLAALRLWQLLATGDADDRRHEAQSAALHTTLSGPNSASLTLTVATAEGPIVVDATVGPREAEADRRIVVLRDASERLARERDLGLAARTDHTTQLANRLGMSTAMEDLATRDAPVTLVLLDLDGFKEVNDRHGHPTGDAVLRVIGDRLRRVLREGDVAARMGGDEFAALLPGAPQEVAARVADRILQTVSTLIVVGGTRVRVGGSLGVSSTHAARPSLDALLSEADHSLREAKVTGKGKVVVARRGPDDRSDVIPGVVVADARAWADHLRAVRAAIGQAKDDGRLPPQLAAPENVHRTLLDLLGAIDALPHDAADTGAVDARADLRVPPVERLVPFAIYVQAAMDWVERLHAHGVIDAVRPPGARRFWATVEAHLDRLAWGRLAPPA